MLADYALPLLRRLPPEAAHRVTLRGLALGMGPRAQASDPPRLAMRLWGRVFPNPVGLAAGFDKHAEVPDAILALGFGFTEIGTVTPRPQPGNPKPRLFRLEEDLALINRLGFNSEGLAAVQQRLERRREQRGGAIAVGPLGANLGRNRETGDEIEDYVLGVRALAPLVDYLAVNISSPNTPGLRDLQRKNAVERLLERLLPARADSVPDNPPPLLLKIAPDLTQEERADLAQAALAGGVDGLIVANTTVARPESLRSDNAHEPGGLSGRPLMAPATRLIADMARLTAGRLPIIGVGGIASGADAYAKIRAGASLVQLYTALVYQGPGLVTRVKHELDVLLARDGFATVADAVGKAMPRQTEPLL
ncbi:MAG TPA: quinone-dependent dihydroorotate dehydrogenase [Stellaceae bacterium]|jgi:dihydroorotate dehydrogenase|nr:quinone-dependent dihydroorotate dehydrogenase [Stellaceae bacterium]